MLYVFTEKTWSKIWHGHDYHYELQNITTFWLVWNKILQQQKQLPNDQIISTWCIASLGNVSKAGILTSFQKIWNCRERKKRTLNGTFWRFLKRFGTADKNENNVSKACIVTVFQTIWNCREKKKTRTVNGAFCKEIDESNVSKACILTGLGICR